MAFLTDRKRATGMGSAKSGTHHHWQMLVSSVALTALVPLFVFTYGYALGMSYDDAAAYYAPDHRVHLFELCRRSGWRVRNRADRTLIYRRPRWLNTNTKRTNMMSSL